MLFICLAQLMLFVYPVQWMLFVGSAYISGVPSPEAVEAGASFPFMGSVPVPEAGALLSVSGVSD